MKYTYFAIAVLLLSCGGTDPMPADDVEVVAAEVTIGDRDNISEDIVEGPLCKVAWNLALAAGGDTSHPALQKSSIYIGSGQGKLFSVNVDGDLRWTWPDDDPEMMVEPVDAQLYSPAIGINNILYMGTGDSRLLAVVDAANSPKGRFLAELDGVVSGAPAIATDEKGKSNLVVALTDSGTVHVIKDLGTGNPYEMWSKVDDQALPSPLTGVQPIVGPGIGDARKTIWVPGTTQVKMLNLDDGYELGEFEMPDDWVITSNLIMNEDGTVTFVAARDPMADYFKEHQLMTVTPEGVQAEGSPIVVDLGGKLTRIVSLSTGIKSRLLMGTNNEGLVVYSLLSNSVFKTTTGESSYFENVPAPVEATDGLIYYAAFPHYILVASEQAELLWEKKLDTVDGSIGSQLRPSSPLLLDDGKVVYHNGNMLHAILCTESTPPVVAWPRFGGNNKNTGNWDDSPVMQQEAEENR